MASVKFEVKKRVSRRFLRLLMRLHSIGVKCVHMLPWSRRQLKANHPRTILLTGTFFSSNWIMNFLGPLAASKCCSQIWIVCTLPVPPTSKVKWIAPPGWLKRIFGETLARLSVATLIALWKRPDIIGGFHMIVNGLFTAFIAPIVAARSVYFCGGGPTEVLGGGISGNRFFSLFLTEPDRVLEERLIKTVKSFDLVMTMGSRATHFFREHNVDNRFEIVPLGIDRSNFHFLDGPKVYDLIFIGRLSPVKRIDLFLKIVGKLRKDIPDVKAVIVGKGQLENSLKDLAVSLGISDNVMFAGYQSDIFEWLQKSKVFMLTSDSEGLSLALIEAMMCGVPCVVSDVGELGELVDHGINGYLVKHQSIDEFTATVSSLLSDSRKLKQCSEAARNTARKYDLNESAKRWDQILMQI